MKRKDGFTLAEVLITLTIIGVISALTLPAIQSNTAASRNRATLKNTMAILSQAAQANMASEGWNFAHAAEECSWVADAEEHNSMDNYTVCGLLNSNLAGETFLGQCLPTGRPTNGQYQAVNNLPNFAYGSYVVYLLSNGAIVGFTASDSTGTYCNEDKALQTHSCNGFIDVNGMQGPHREITCTNGTRRADQDSSDRTNTCEVERTANADIFPFRYYDSTIELSTDAARSFLNAR